MARVEADRRPVRTLLIANRGEIAVRIERTCRRLGIATVAVYSTPDANALHVRHADRARHIGPAPAIESYLNIPAIIDAACLSGADAIHPGYGFLAENADFAQAVIDAGLTWIGPSPEVIRLLGDKVAAKAVAMRAGVPTVPGYGGPDLSYARLVTEAKRIGFPVMVKAAAGGGGKGMRAVTAMHELEEAVAAARREAHAAFGDERVFLEKLIERPRHIEFQVLFDSHGHGIHLGERECSVQRRHQKVLEEAPSTVLTPELREAMGADAVRLVQEAGYVNAGTVEYLFDGEQYYFLEVNTRIQVEHPVTEMVTGLDLVELQIAVAQGDALPLAQADVSLDGFAAEVRIYAEDPAHGFLPAAGTIDMLTLPEWPGIRNDVGIYAGARVGTWYDPMLAKLIVHDASRTAVFERLQAALARYDVAGMTTNLPFLRWLARRPEILRGEIDITFLDRAWAPDRMGSDLPIEVATGVAIWLDGQARIQEPWDARSGWRMFGFPRTYRLGLDGNVHTVEVVAEPERKFTSCMGDYQCTGKVLECGSTSVAWSSESVVTRLEFCRNGQAIEVRERGATYRIELAPPPDAEVHSSPGVGGVAASVAPMPATVIRVIVEAGQHVQPHQPLVVLEAMKMEHVVEAAQAGIIAEVLVAEGELVAAGAPMVRMEQ